MTSSGSSGSSRQGATNEIDRIVQGLTDIFAYCEPHITKWFPLVLLIACGEFAVSLWINRADLHDFIPYLHWVIFLVVPLVSFIFALIANLLFTAFFGLCLPIVQKQTGFEKISAALVVQLFGYLSLVLGVLITVRAPLEIVLHQTVEGHGVAFLMMALAFRIRF